MPVVQQETYAAPHAAKEAREQLGGISPTTFYALVKEGELSLVKIGRRSFVQAEELDDFLRRSDMTLRPRHRESTTGLRGGSWRLPRNTANASLRWSAHSSEPTISE